MAKRKCEFCEMGLAVHRWPRHDGTGSWRMHDFVDNGTVFCGRNSWFSRHRFCAAAVGTLLALAVLVAIAWLSGAPVVQSRASTDTADRAIVRPAFVSFDRPTEG